MLICLTFVTCSVAQGASQYFIKYISAESVYLDGGEAEGLKVGAKLTAIGSNGKKTDLLVVFVSAHSASCTITSAASEVQVGDKVLLDQLPNADSTLQAVDSSVQLSTLQTPASIVSAPSRPSKSIRRVAPLTGSVSTIFYQWNDNGDANLDFSQLTTRLSLKARRLWGREITFTVRGRGRFDKRSREYRPDVARDEWENNLWEFSLSYEDPASPVNLFAGRILPRGAGGAGYLDGALFEGKLSKNISVSGYGGGAPELFYSEQTLALMKYGGYLSFQAGDYQHTYFEQSFGLAFERHGSEVNREYLFLQGRLSQGTSWGFSNSAEIDINTGWRKEKAGSATTLSNVYMNWWLRPALWYRISLSYDNRKNYWTYANRSMVDSLFDKNLRQGVRAQSEMTLPAKFYPSLSISYRKEKPDSSATWSYSFLIRKGDAIVKNLTAVLQYALFDGPFSSGHNSAIRANYQALNSLGLGVGVTNYTYSTSSSPEKRSNSTIELTSQFDFGRRYWMGTMLQSNIGEDSRGLRLQVELGLRF